MCKFNLPISTETKTKHCLKSGTGGAGRNSGKGGAGRLQTAVQNVVIPKQNGDIVLKVDSANQKHERIKELK
jgi:hypothetical protein